MLSTPSAEQKPAHFPEGIVLESSLDAISGLHSLWHDPTTPSCFSGGFAKDMNEELIEIEMGSGEALIRWAPGSRRTDAGITQSQLLILG